METVGLNKAIYERFKYYYQHSSLDILMLKDIYHADIQFKDPVHQINGLEPLVLYFSKMSVNMNACRFEFVEELCGDATMHITWNMYFSHAKIDGGKAKMLRGMSFIRIKDEKVIYHEDCYDLGAMVYDYVPVLGRMTRWIRQKMVSSN